MAWASAIASVLSLPPISVAAARAVRPPDDWGMTRADDDAGLVAQRIAKLVRSPFSQTHWRPLLRALGPRGLEQRLLQGARRDPEQPAWTILLARLELSRGHAAAAADRLAALTTVPPAWARPVRDLEVDALRAAGRDGAAIDRLAPDPMTAPLVDLELALSIATQRGLDDVALRLAKVLAQRRPDDSVTAQQLAERAATRGAYELADQAWQAAIASSSGRRRIELVVGRAQTRLDADDPAQAATMLWTLLGEPRTGRHGERATWWSMFESAMTRGAATPDWTDAVASLLESSSTRRSEVAAWRAWGTLRVLGGESPASVWSEVLARAPADHGIRMALVRGLEGDGQVDRIVAEVERLDYRQRLHVDFALATASRLIVNGERLAALSIADGVASARPRDGEVAALLLEFFNANGETDRALDVARQWVRIRPRDVDARLALGEQLFEMNAVDEAMQQWQWLPPLTSPRHAGWARLAQVLAEHANAARGRNLRKGALESLERALSDAPREASYHRLRAILEEERRAYDGALESWLAVRRYAKRGDQAVLEEESRTRIVELLVGMGLTRRDEARAAVETEARTALDGGRGNESLAAGRLLAELYAREENHDEAVAVLRQLDALAPGDPERMLDLASALRRAGGNERRREAITILEQVVEIDPRRRGEVLAEMSEIAFLTGDDQAALERARAAVAEGDVGGHALVRLGELLEQKGDLATAVAVYNEALVSRPRDVQAGLRLADLRLLDGDADGAMAVFDDLVRRGRPEDLTQADVRRLLDVAQAMGRTVDLLDIVIERASADTRSEAVGELALEILDRVTPEQTSAWMTSGEGRSAAREAALRRVLLSSLAQGSIGMRSRAARHLAALGLPDTAVSLARVGANLTAHRDTSAAIAQGYQRARVDALVAAGKLDDASALTVIGDVALRRGGASAARQAAVWALANSSSKSAATYLSRVLAMTAEDDPQTIALTCVGLARLGTKDPVARRAIGAAARHAAHRTTRQACAYAEMRVESGPRGVSRWLAHPDELVVALALSQAMPDASVFRAITGPSGPRRDAAVAGLARALAGDSETPMPVIPTLDDDDWALVVQRWLADRAVARVDGITPEELAPHASSIVAAVRANLSGTPAQRRAARNWIAACFPGLAMADDDLVAQIDVSSAAMSRCSVARVMVLLAGE